MNDGRLKLFVRDVLRGITTSMLIVATLLAIPSALLVMDFILRSLWNFVVPDIFAGIPELKPLQGAALWLIVDAFRGKLGDGLRAVKMTLKHMRSEFCEEIDKMLAAKNPPIKRMTSSNITLQKIEKI